MEYEDITYKYLDRINRMNRIISVFLGERQKVH